MALGPLTPLLLTCLELLDIFIVPERFRIKSAGVECSKFVEL
jgi:hypothetical protein